MKIAVVSVAVLLAAGVAIVWAQDETTESRPERQQWEYKVVSTGGQVVEDAMNRQGKDGWELVAVRYNSQRDNQRARDSDHVVCYFKRPTINALREVKSEVRETASTEVEEIAEREATVRQSGPYGIRLSQDQSEEVQSLVESLRTEQPGEDEEIRAKQAMLERLNLETVAVMHLPNHQTSESLDRDIAVARRRLDSLRRQKGLPPSQPADAAHDAAAEDAEPDDSTDATLDPPNEEAL